MKVTKLQRRTARKRRINVSGTTEKPRLVVFRSLNHVYAQVINDEEGKTVASASDLSLKLKGGKMEKAKEVGKAVAEKAQSAGVTSVVFDRNGYKYTGSVKELAEAAREAGLKF